MKSPRHRQTGSRGYRRYVYALLAPLPPYALRIGISHRARIPTASIRIGGMARAYKELEVMIMKMFWMAGLVFAADVLAVVLIFLSLSLEDWLGLPRGVVLDFIFLAAVCYGLAGWIVGKLFMLEFPRPALGRQITLRSSIPFVGCAEPESPLTGSEFALGIQLKSDGSQMPRSISESCASRSCRACSGDTHRRPCGCSARVRQAGPSDNC
jgi:hypothetical protein